MGYFLVQGYALCGLEIYITLGFHPVLVKKTQNGLHWVLDIAFREDDCRIRKGYGPQNFALLRHVALNLLKQEATAKIGVKNKRLQAGWDEAYLCQVLFGEI